MANQNLTTSLEDQRIARERSDQQKRQLNELHDSALKGVEKAKTAAKEAQEEQRKFTSQKQKEVQDLENRVASYESEYEQLSRTHNTQVQQSKNQEKILQLRIDQLVEGESQAKMYRDTAHDLSEENHRLARQLAEAREIITSQSGSTASSLPRHSAGGNGAPGLGDDLEGLRKELRTQANSLSALQKHNASLLQEVVGLRQRRDNVEMVKKELIQVEKNARDKIRIVQDELNQARREME